MTLHQCRVFNCLAKSLNVTKAAHVLHCTQPSVSRHLRNLQAELGTLYKRKGRQIELTARGKKFLKDMQPLLSHAAFLQAKYGAAPRGEKRETLNIGGTLGLATFILPRLAGQFRQSHPKIDVNLDTGTSLEILGQISDGKMELALVANPLFTPLLATEPFRKEIRSVFVAMTHPLAKKHKISAETLADLPLVIRGGPNSRNSTDERLSELIARGLNPRVLMRLESVEAMKAAVKDGALAGILYRDLIAEEIRRGVFATVQVTGLDLSARSYIVYSKERPLSATASEFLVLLRAARGNTHILRPQAKAVSRSLPFQRPPSTQTIN